MINNRQNGRRRGRGGAQRPPSNVSSQGNRQDNRSRGNAAQLHEKYKTLARDSQLSGDRVQTEYFLQFADHYYRVLNESRARFEEQRRPRDDYEDDEDQDDALNAGDMDEGQERDSDDRPEPRRQRGSEPRADARPREDREHRSSRDQSGEREQRPVREPREDREPRAGREDREQRPKAEQDSDREARNAGERRPRRERVRRDRPEEQESEGQERISLEALPPAIAADAGEAPAKPVRRRTRRPSPDVDVDIAPAA